MLLNQQHQADIDGITPMPTDRVDDTSTNNTSSAETVVWYYNNSGAWGAAAAQAAGTICAAKVAYTGVTNALGSSVGNYYDTSLSFGAATRASTLVLVSEEVFSKMERMSVANKIATITPFLTTAGDYAVDHRRGQIWLNSKDTVANDAATYIYQTPLSGGGAGDKVDLIKIGGEAVGDHDTAVIDHGLQPLLEAKDYDGSALPNAVTEGDAVRQAATLSGIAFTMPVNEDGSKSPLVTDDSAQVATPEMYNVGGEYRAADTTYTDGDATVLQTDANGYLKSVSKSYDSSTQADKTAEVNPLSSQYVSETLVDETNITTNTTTYAYFDMNGFRNFTLQGETSDAAPTDVLTVTVEASCQDDGTAAASCAYQDVTNALFGVASWVDTDFMAIGDTPMALKYVRVKYVTSNGAGNDADLTVYLKKQY
jgi:hypothetical protein